MLRNIAASLLVVAFVAGCQQARQADSLTPGNTMVESSTPAPAPTPTPTLAIADPNPDPAVVTATPTAAPAPIAQPARKTHVVKRGDTLWSIAKANYGDGKQYTRIVSANPGLSPQGLKVGQTIVIP